MFPFSGGAWFNSKNSFIPSSNLATTSSTTTTFSGKTTKAATASLISMADQMDRKTRKPLIEKHRRVRINQALDAMKGILLGYNLSHESTLVKADIAEKAVEYMLEQQRRIAQLQQELADLKRQSATTTPIPKPATPTTSTTNQARKLPASQQQPLPIPLNPMLLSQPNLLSYQMLLSQLFNPARMQMSSTAATKSTTNVLPKTSMNSPISSLSNVTTTKNDSESDSGSSDDDNNNASVDVDGHDETFSPPTTPNMHHLPQIQSRKRRQNSFNTTSKSAAATSEGDDSGIFDGPSPPKKPSPSFALNDLLK